MRNGTLPFYSTVAIVLFLAWGYNRLPHKEVSVQDGAKVDTSD